MDQETKALALRSKAQALLEEAQALDGLKPYAIVHDHQYGVSCYITWCESEPDLTQAQAVLDCEFEPDRSESLHILSDLTVAELCATSVASRMELLPGTQSESTDTNQDLPG